MVVKGLDPGVDVSRYRFTGVVRIFDEFVDGLTGLEAYSHAILVFHLHMVDGWTPVVSFKGKRLGVFATRSPFRPNPIGISVVKIEEIDPPYLMVSGLDAWTGSPVLDLKPYDFYDIVCRPSTPDYDKDSFLSKKESELLPEWVGPC